MIDNDSLPCILVFDFFAFHLGILDLNEIDALVFELVKNDNESGELILVSSVSLLMSVQ